jgi:hypothetical protein
MLQSIVLRNRFVERTARTSSRVCLIDQVPSFTDWADWLREVLKRTVCLNFCSKAKLVIRDLKCLFVVLLTCFLGRRTIGLASSGTVGVSLSHRTSDSCGRPGAVRANKGCQVHGVSSDTLVLLVSGLDACCVKKQCGLVGLCIGGRMTFNLRLSRAHTGVVAMRQGSSY